MSQPKIKPLWQTEKPENLLSSSNAYSIAKLVDFSADGRPLISYAGQKDHPIPARVLSSVAISLETINCDSDHLLLVLPENDPSELPIIIGLIDDTIQNRNDKSDNSTFDNPFTVSIDGKKAVLSAKHEISISCGKSSITLRNDGKIVIKGSQIVSRASKENKIKGATVKVN